MMPSTIYLYFFIIGVLIAKSFASPISEAQYNIYDDLIVSDDFGLSPYQNQGKYQFTNLE